MKNNDTSSVSRTTWSAWSDNEPLECVAVHREMLNAATFSFRAPSGALFDFDPGQFLTLEIPVEGGAAHRTYTISSSPSRPRSINITAKAQDDSIGTRWMLDNLKPGMRIKATGPAGAFTNVHSKADKYLFVSAGSGVTPMMSMTTCLWDEGRPLDIVFINCAHRPSELLFKQSLEHLASRSSGLNLKFVVEEPDPYQPWTGYQGRLNQVMLGQIAPDYLEREVYCCGPEPFMQSMREALIGLGYNMDGYHQESFGTPASLANEVATFEDKSPSDDLAAEVHFASSDTRQTCAQTDTILSAAKSAGISIPTGCTFGLCGTCKVKKTSGEVHMVHSGGITEQDIAADYILACCSNPIGKVTIDL
ncbi:MAG: 2Fe-2S iron-sulfur cluster-binding protein [Cognatishimia sp.]